MQTPFPIRRKRLGPRNAAAAPSPAPPSGGGGSGGIGVPPTVYPLGPPSRGYVPAPYREAGPRRLEDAATGAWLQQVVERQNNILQGRLNVTLAVTLAANAGETVVIDSRIGAFAGLTFCPLTADAAAEMAAGTMFVSEQTTGSATITHANNAQADRLFTLIILG